MRTERFVTWRWMLFFMVLSVAGAGWRPLWDPDEGRYAEVAREMFRSGKWLVPTLEGSPHLTKPPLTYWMTAVGYHLFGLNEWGARIFTTLCFLLTILCVIELAKTWKWSREASLASGLIFSTAALPFACGHILTTDMYLTLFETLGVLCAWKTWTRAEGEMFWRWGFWVAFGLAFLTKGPPGWLPLMAIVAYPFVSGAFKPEGKLRSFVGVGLFIVISFSWYYAVVLRDESRAEYFIVDEVYKRIFTGEHNRDNPWWTHIITIVFGFFPWIFLWPQMLKRTSATVRRGWTSMTGHQRFTLLWFFLTLAVLLIAKSRMMLYVVPLYAPLAIWGGKILAKDYLSQESRHLYMRRTVLVPAGVWIFLLLLVSVYPGAFPGSRTEKGLATDIHGNKDLAGQQLVYYTIKGNTYHTASFYLDTVIDSLDVSYQNIPHLADVLRAKGGEPVFLIKENRFKNVLRNGVPAKVVGRGRTNIAFMVDKELADKRAALIPDEPEEIMKIIPSDEP